MVFYHYLHHKSTFLWSICVSWGVTVLLCYLQWRVEESSPTWSKQQCLQPFFCDSGIKFEQTRPQINWKKVLSMSTTQELTSTRKRSNTTTKTWVADGNNSHLEWKCGGGIIIITWQFVFQASNTVYSERPPKGNCYCFSNLSPCWWSC